MSRRYNLRRLPPTAAPVLTYRFRIVGVPPCAPSSQPNPKTGTLPCLGRDVQIFAERQTGGGLMLISSGSYRLTSFVGSDNLGRPVFRLSAKWGKTPKSGLLANQKNVEAILVGAEHAQSRFGLPMPEEKPPTPIPQPEPPSVPVPSPDPSHYRKPTPWSTGIKHPFGPSGGWR